MTTSPVTYVPTDVLMARLSHSVDMDADITERPACEIGYGGECPQRHSLDQWQELWDSKYDECAEEFIDSVCDSFDVPVCVWVRGELEELPGTLPGLELQDSVVWAMGNGHHRVAVAINNGLQAVPVVFSFDSDALHREITAPIDRMESDGY